MKKIKKLLIGIMTAAMVLGSVMTVSAEPSYSTDITVPEDSESYGYYVVLPILQENFVGKEALYNEILEYNAGSLTVEELLSDEIEGVDGGAEAWNFIKTNNMIAFTDMFDVQPVGTAEENDTHRFTIHIPTLTSEMKVIRFLHFSMERSVWELLTPESVDYDKKLVTLHTDDLSPMMGFSTEKLAASGGGNSGSQSTTTQTPAATQSPAATVPTSPKTAGTASDWMIWMAAAVVLAAAGTVVLRKKHN